MCHYKAGNAARFGQADHKAKYRGEYQTDSSHYVSKEEMEVVRLSNKTMNDINSCGNYRNKNSATNKQFDRRMENQLIGILSGCSYDYSHVNDCNAGHYTQQNQIDRLVQRHGVLCAAFNISQSQTEKAKLMRLMEIGFVALRTLNVDMRTVRMPTM